MNASALQLTNLPVLIYVNDTIWLGIFISSVKTTQSDQYLCTALNDDTTARTLIETFCNLGTPSLHAGHHQFLKTNSKEVTNLQILRN